MAQPPPAGLRSIRSLRRKIQRQHGFAVSEEQAGWVPGMSDSLEVKVLCTA